MLYRNHITEKWVISYTAESASSITIPFEKYSGKQWMLTKDETVIPGSTMKGLISSYLDRILNSGNRNDISGYLWGFATPTGGGDGLGRKPPQDGGDYNDWKGIVSVKNALLNIGEGKTASRIHFGHVSKAKPKQKISGDGHLRPDHLIIPPPFSISGNLEIHIPKGNNNGLIPPSEVISGLICIALSSLGNGMVQVGGEGSRGCGWFEKLNISSIDVINVKNLVSGGDNLASKKPEELMNSAKEWLAEQFKNTSSVECKMEEIPDFSKFHEGREWKMYNLEIEATEPNNFKPPAMKSNSPSTATPLKDGKGKIIAPGSMIKGMLRNEIININEGAKKEWEKSNPHFSLDCSLFGGDSKKSFASRLVVSDFIWVGMNKYKGRILLRDSDKALGKVFETLLRKLKEDGLCLSAPVTSEVQKTKNRVKLLSSQVSRFIPSSATFETYSGEFR